MISYSKEKLNILFLIRHLAKNIGQASLPYFHFCSWYRRRHVVLILLAVCTTKSEKNLSLCGSLFLRNISPESMLLREHSSLSQFDFSCQT